MTEWLRKFLDATDPTSSLRHAAFAAVIGSSIVWLTMDLAKAPMSERWVAAFGLLLGAVTVAKTVGKEPGQ